MSDSNNPKVCSVKPAPRRRALIAAASLIGISVAAGLGLTPAPQARAADAPGVLVLGDSLSAEYGLPRGRGWVALLAQRLASRTAPYAVINASVSGETTAGGRSRIADLLARHKPRVVIVELGGNDALRGLELGRTERNLRDIARLSRRAGARVLLLGMMVPPNYGRQYSEQFAAIYPRVADAEKATLVPFFLDGVAERIELFQADRIHPTAQAQPILLANVWPALEPLL